MPVKTVVTRSGGSAPWLLPFLYGAAAGLAAGVLLGRRGSPASAENEETAAARWERMGRAWESARDSLAAARGRLRDPVPVDAVAVQAAVREVRGAEAVEARVLGPGIVELVGWAEDEGVALRVRERVAREPGVRSVVSRVWTSASGATIPATSPRRPDNNEDEIE